MKAIIAPIDFSEASINALSFAAELSKRASVRLIVLNTLQRDDDEMEAKSKLELVKSNLKDSFGPDLKCETLLAKGDLISVLNELIIAEKPDLIIMGTKGASGIKRILIGSNAVNVISEIKIPVLVIPEMALYKDFIKRGKNRIVLATDLELLENERCVNILKEMAMFMFEPKVRVLNVRPKHTKLPELKKIERSFLLSVFKPEIESKSVTLFGNNILEGINYYLDKKTDCGLIAMIATESGSLFEKHYTREMATHTNLPLLVLHDV
ncbi:MAG: universal stress protein [Bacteroidia bacterium]|nr:universal stress protein [Bacteroidia bacterium]